MKKFILLLLSGILIVGATNFTNLKFKKSKESVVDNKGVDNSPILTKPSKNLGFSKKNIVQNFSLRRLLVFEENIGQVRDQNNNLRSDVLYSGTDGKMNFHLKATGISYQLHQVLTWKIPDSEKLASVGQNHPDNIQLQRIDLDWIGCQNASISGDEELEDKTNYFSEGLEYYGAKSYNRVRYENIYNLIDLIYYESDGGLKHDWIVKPGGDFSQIKIKISGATVQVGENGEVILQTPTGNCQEFKPIAFQEGRELPAKWEIKGDTLTFDINGYDPTKELTIDPLTRVWGSYYGGTNTDYGEEVATDASNNVYLVGYTFSTGNIATVGSFQTIISSTPDAYLVKFSTNGVRQWGTYYGGTSTDYGQGCCTDPSGNVYLVGYTFSNGLATAGSHQTTLSGGPDAFLVKFNTSGTRLWATYYGGTLTEYGEGVACDPSGNVYFSGRSSSTSSISTVGSHQFTKSSGTDGMLVKFNTNGVRQWGTYYGGTGTDYCFDVCVDASSNVFINGYTTSSGGISTAGSHQPTLGGGSDDYIAKFNTNGVRQWGTYYGGTTTEFGYGIACDATGNVFTTGYTQSANNISSPGSQQPTPGTFPDAFVTKFNTNGVRQWGTYLGGGGDDRSWSICTGTLGNVYVVGQTSSANNISTANSFQQNVSGTPDAFIVEYNTNGVIQSGTYYGGTSLDYGDGVCSDASGNIYICGYTYSSNQMFTPGAHQVAISTTPDAFVAKFQFCSVPQSPLNLSGTPTICANQTTTLSASQTGTINNWYASPTGTISLGTGTLFTTPSIAVGTTSFWVGSSGVCGESNPRTLIQVTGINGPNLQATPSNQNICLNSNITLTVSGGVTYTWSPGASNSSSITVTPLVNTVYTVSSGNFPCTQSKTIAVTVSVQPSSPVATPTSAFGCGTAVGTFTASGSNGNYIWSTGLNSPPFSTVNPFTTPQLTTTTTYYLGATSGTPQLGSSGSYTFTNCSATGSLGPTQAQVNAAYLSTNLNGSVTISTQGIQNFTIPFTGPYRITSIGAKGFGTNGGLGTRIIGEFNFSAGTVLKMRKGQQGEPPISPGTNQYGGGGGSFVTFTNNTPLIVAGGGGGSWAQTFTGLSNAQLGTTGGNGVNGPTNGLGGTGGLGGATAGFADGGGGLTGNGGGTTGGFSFLNGANGGAQYGHGGFGGGGGASSWNNRRGCGGGGYSGGGGAGSTTTGFPEGGGGASFNSGTNQSNTAGVGTGHGTVIIESLSGGGSQCTSPLVPVTVTVGPIQPTISVTNQTICSNGSSTLTASGSPNYTWSPGNFNTSSIVVTPTTSTIYTVSGGVIPCADSKTVGVTVLQTPNIPTVIPNNFTLCSSQSTVLNAVSNSTNFTWYNSPNGSIIGVTPNYSIIGINTSTNYYVSASAIQGTQPGSQTFNFTGNSQIFTVPPLVTQVLLETWGAEGGGFPLSGNTWSGNGGKGGYSAGFLTVTPGQTLQINVGGSGGSSTTGIAPGGWNGGGSGWASGSTEPGNGGGGASDVRSSGISLTDRVIVAGGGGGGGEDAGDQVGQGGGLTGIGYITYDATQLVAGAGGGLGFGGTTGQGDGGGGGGGLYGGGTFSSAVIGTDTQGGGGGSGFIGGVTSPTIISGNLSMPNPAGGTMTGNSGNGLIRISWSGTSNLCSSPLATVNVIGIPSPTISATATETFICTGTLTSVLSSTGATSYTWQPVNQIGSSITVTPNVTTTYTVFGSNGNGCIDTKSINIQVCAFLPIELLSFDVTGELNRVRLDWVTQSEKNTKKFIIERTLDFNSWKEVCMTTAAGYSTGKRFYFCYDQSPMDGINYYRLKTINDDGTFDYSETKFVNFKTQLTSVSVYPNPNTGLLWVSYQDFDTQLEIIDVVGRKIIIESENKFKDSGKWIQIFNTIDLSPGVYFVKVNQTGINELLKFVKQ
jgi:hypothetical protein